jgi:hypothetical protein
MMILSHLDNQIGIDTLNFMNNSKQTSTAVKGAPAGRFPFPNNQVLVNILKSSSAWVKVVFLLIQAQLQNPFM